MMSRLEVHQVLTQVRDVVRVKNLDFARKQAAVRGGKGPLAA